MKGATDIVHSYWYSRCRPYQSVEGDRMKHLACQHYETLGAERCSMRFEVPDHCELCWHFREAVDRDDICLDDIFPDDSCQHDDACEGPTDLRCLPLWGWILQLVDWVLPGRRLSR